jgi:hypothetical protein
MTMAMAGGGGNLMDIDVKNGEVRKADEFGAKLLSPLIATLFFPLFSENGRHRHFRHPQNNSPRTATHNPQQPTARTTTTTQQQRRRRPAPEAGTINPHQPLYLLYHTINRIATEH